MEPIAFGDFFEFISLETGKSTEDLLVWANSADGGESFVRAAQKAVEGAGPLLLVEPLGTPGGQQVLLNIGADLTSKVEAIARRQLTKPDVPLGPIVLDGNDATASRYRAKVLSCLDPIFERAGPDANPFVQRVHSSLGPRGTEVREAVRDALEKALSSAAGMGHLLRAIRDEQSGRLWERSAATAYVAASLGRVWCAEAKGRVPDQTVRPLAAAGLFQDLSILLRPSLYKNDLTRHPVRSAQLLAEMGFSGRVQELVEDHHHFLKPIEEQGPDEPVEADERREPSPVAYLLVVANMFTASLWSSTRRERDIEGIKALNFLMSEGKLPKEPVGILTRMYFSKKFALFIEKAAEIMGLCPHQPNAKPILWNILGERNPQKFICQLKACPHLGNQVTMIAQPIAVRLEEKVVGQIAQGEYNNCRHLSTELEKLYREIAALSTK